MLYRTYKSSVEDLGGIVYGALPKPDTKLDIKLDTKLCKSSARNSVKALHEAP